MSRDIDAKEMMEVNEMFALMAGFHAESEEAEGLTPKERKELIKSLPFSTEEIRAATGLETPGSKRNFITHVHLEDGTKVEGWAHPVKGEGS